MKNSRFSPQAADRGSVKPGLLLAEKPARHLRWSVAISNAFRRGKGLPPWRPATFIFGLRAKRRLSLVRRVLNFQLSWPRLEQSLVVINNGLAQPLLGVRQENSRAGRDLHSQTPGPRAAPLAFRPSHTRQTLFQAERLCEHRMWLQGPAFARTLWLPSSASTMSARLLANAVAPEGNVPEITTRIASRLKRVEQTSLSPEPRLVAGARPARGFEEIAETPARRLYPNASPVHRSEPGAGGLVPSGMNVTQLTDEVMRQIDRRLVALRERMGKI
jgi:hypothetical protein